MSILDFIIWIPVIGALAIFSGAPARLTALTASIANAVLVLVAWCFVRGDTGANGYALVANRPIWESLGWGYNVGADSLTMILLLLATFVTVTALWNVERTNKAIAAGGLLISAGGIGAFCSTDLFFFFAFHELALIPTFLLIGMQGFGEKRAAAWKTTIYLAAGSMILLVGLLLLVKLYSGGGVTLSIPELHARVGNIPAEGQGGVFLWLVLGFGILISLFPFHGWAIPAYSCAPTPVAMLHAGVLKKFGIYGLIRIALPLLPVGAGMSCIQNILLVLLLGNILWVGYVTVAQRRLETMLASSSVMHMGYAFLGIVSGSVMALEGVALLMLAHGLAIAALLWLTGWIRDTVGTTKFSELGGLGSRTPNLMLLFGMSLFGSIGLPGLGNFAAEFLIFNGSFQSILQEGVLTWRPVHTAAVCAIWGVVISAVYGLRAFQAIFMGSKHAPATARDIRSWSLVPVGLLLLLLFLAGLAPHWVLSGVSELFSQNHPVSLP